MDDKNPTAQGPSITPRLRKLLTEQLEQHLNDLADGPLSYQPLDEKRDPRHRERFYDHFVRKPERRAEWQASIETVRELAIFLGRDLAQPEERLAETEWDKEKRREIVTAERSWAEALLAFEEMIELRNQADVLRTEKRKLLSQTRDINARLRAADGRAKK